MTSARQGVDPNTLRVLNTGVVLRALPELEGPFTVADVVERTGLSRRPIEEILGDLAGRGWVAVADPADAPARTGRPPRRFVFRADQVLLVAIGLDTRAIQAIVTDVRGTVLGRSQRLLEDYFDPDTCVRDAVAVLRGAVEDAGRAVDEVRAGAITGGGVIDQHGVVRHLYNAPNWTDFALADAMTAACGIPFLADNNANLSALAEHWRGAATDHRDFVWAILGNRVGLGIIIDGHIYRGVDGAAGEVVETAVFDFDGLKRHPISWLTSPVEAERSVALDLVALAAAGHEESISLVDEYVDKVVPAVITLAWIIAPPLFVLGGGLEPAGELLAPRIQRRLADAGLSGIAVRAGSLGRMSGMLGGIRAVLDRLDTELFGPTVAVRG